MLNQLQARTAGHSAPISDEAAGTRHTGCPKDQRQRRHSPGTRPAQQFAADAAQARHDVVTLAPASAPLTMSSREIAELVELRHDNVKRTIETLATRGVVHPQAEDEPDADTMGRSRVTHVYLLDKRDACVIAAQLSPEFTGRVVDRWQELEAQQHAAAPTLPRTFAEALRLAADQAEQLDAQRVQIEQQRPAVEFMERFVDSTGLMGVRQVAKVLKANEREFTAWLEARGIMYRLAGRLMPMAQHLNAGRFEVKTGTADNGHAFAAPRFTPKGVQWVIGEWGKRPSAH